jgi:copper(I)-binding protein
MTRPLFALVLALACASPAFAAENSNTHKTQVQGVEILHPWARATRNGRTQVFLEMLNDSGRELSLRGGAAVDGPGRLRVMASPLRAGGAPVLLDAVPIPAGSDFDLEPEGVYLELDGLEGGLEQGAQILLSLDLDPIGTVEITVDVEAENAMQHSHARHSH